MSAPPLWRYAGRFVLPLLLLAGSIATWIVADRLSAVNQAAPALSAAEQPAAPLASIRRLPDFATGTSQQQRVADALAALPTPPPGSLCAHVLVDGEPVLALREQQALRAPYAQMAITADAAIEILGPDFVFETQVLANDPPDADGRIGAGMYLIGGGDPVLRTNSFAFRTRPPRSDRTPLEELARAVVDAGVTRVDGGVLGVDRRYDNQRVLSGWEGIVAAGTIGPLGALLVNNGLAPGVPGELPRFGPVPEPAAAAADELDDALERLGVQMSDLNRAVRADEEIPSLVPIASISSPPLGDIVFQMLATNDATVAEMLIKEIGAATTGIGSTQSGSRAVQEVLADRGVDRAVPYRDGSGLDPIGGTTCVDLSTAVDAIPADHPTLDVLPRHDLPGVFDGEFAAIDLDVDLRLVGGRAGDAAAFVARTVGADATVTVASIVNRPGGPTARDLAYQRALVEVVDALGPAISLEAVVPDQ